MRVRPITSRTIVVRTTVVRSNMVLIKYISFGKRSYFGCYLVWTNRVQCIDNYNFHDWMGNAPLIGLTDLVRLKNNLYFTKPRTHYTPQWVTLLVKNLGSLTNFLVFSMKICIKWIWIENIAKTGKSLTKLEIIFEFGVVFGSLSSRKMKMAPVKHHPQEMAWCCKMER